LKKYLERDFITFISSPSNFESIISHEIIILVKSIAFFFFKIFILKNNDKNDWRRKEIGKDKNTSINEDAYKSIFKVFVHDYKDLNKHFIMFAKLYE